MELVILIIPLNVLILIYSLLLECYIEMLTGIYSRKEKFDSM